MFESAIVLDNEGITLADSVIDKILGPSEKEEPSGSNLITNLEESNPSKKDEGASSSSGL